MSSNANNPHKMIHDDLKSMIVKYLHGDLPTTVKIGVVTDLMRVNSFSSDLARVACALFHDKCDSKATDLKEVRDAVLERIGIKAQLDNPYVVAQLVGKNWDIWDQRRDICLCDLVDYVVDWSKPEIARVAALSSVKVFAMMPDELCTNDLSLEVFKKHGPHGSDSSGQFSHSNRTQAELQTLSARYRKCVTESEAHAVEMFVKNPEYTTNIIPSSEVSKNQRLYGLMFKNEFDTDFTWVSTTYDTQTLRGWTDNIAASKMAQWFGRYGSISSKETLLVVLDWLEKRIPDQPHHEAVSRIFASCDDAIHKDVLFMKTLALKDTPSSAYFMCHAKIDRVAKNEIYCDLISKGIRLHCGIPNDVCQLKAHCVAIFKALKGHPDCRFAAAVCAGANSGWRRERAFMTAAMNAYPPCFECTHIETRSDVDLLKILANADASRNKEDYKSAISNAELTILGSQMKSGLDDAIAIAVGLTCKYPNAFYMLDEEARVPEYKQKCFDKRPATFYPYLSPEQQHCPSNVKKILACARSQTVPHIPAVFLSDPEFALYVAINQYADTVIPAIDSVVGTPFFSASPDLVVPVAETTKKMPPNVPEELWTRGLMEDVVKVAPLAYPKLPEAGRKDYTVSRAACMGDVRVLGSLHDDILKSDRVELLFHDSLRKNCGEPDATSLVEIVVADLNPISKEVVRNSSRLQFLLFANDGVALDAYNRLSDMPMLENSQVNRLCDALVIMAARFPSLREFVEKEEERLQPFFCGGFDEEGRSTIMEGVDRELSKRRCLGETLNPKCSICNTEDASAFDAGAHSCCKACILSQHKIADDASVKEFLGWGREQEIEEEEEFYIDED